MPEPRHDWTISEIESIYTAPLLDLLLRAQLVHRDASSVERSAGLRAAEREERRVP